MRRFVRAGKEVGREEMGGWSLGGSVSFAARTVVEMMVCEGREEEELVRAIVDGMVVRLRACGGVDD